MKNKKVKTTYPYNVLRKISTKQYTFIISGRGSGKSLLYRYRVDDNKNG